MVEGGRTLYRYALSATVTMVIGISHTADDSRTPTAPRHARSTRPGQAPTPPSCATRPGRTPSARRVARPRRCSCWPPRWAARKAQAPAHTHRSRGHTAGARRPSTTGGGAYVAGSVNTGGNCVGRDQIVYALPPQLYGEKVKLLQKVRGTDVAPLSRNIRQPNHVLIHSLAGFKAQRRPRAGEERLAGTKHDRVQVDAILINKAEVRHASRQVRACNVNFSVKP
jgi:hypothetical protein